jgi:hypothetical protein
MKPSRQDEIPMSFTYVHVTHLPNFTCPFIHTFVHLYLIPITLSPSTYTLIPSTFYLLLHTLYLCIYTFIPITIIVRGVDTQCVSSETPRTIVRLYRQRQVISKQMCNRPNKCLQVGLSIHGRIRLPPPSMCIT